MSRLKWREAFGVGHAGLDAQHQDLIARINRICALSEASGWRAQLHALAQAAEQHFDYEIAVLREVAGSGNPAAADVGRLTTAGIAEHAAEHGRALDRLRAIITTIEGDGPAASAGCDEIVKWFLDHSIGQDAHLKTVFQAI